MIMKENAMENRQLKPAFNLQHGVDSEYITWLTIGPQPTDTTFKRGCRFTIFQSLKPQPPSLGIDAKHYMKIFSFSE